MPWLGMHELDTARKEALAAEASDRTRHAHRQDWMHRARWEDWCLIADGFAVGRVEAMRRAKTNQPHGRAYALAFARWMAERPWASNIDKATRNHLLWVAAHRSEIEAWRDTLTLLDRGEINHPTSLRRRWDDAHKPAGADPNAPKKATTREALVRLNEELRAEIARLKRMMIEQGDGSLFDLRRASVDDIVDVMGGTVPLDRFESLQRSMTKKLATLKSATRHAQAG
jgi:hypothetical protein